MMMVAGGQNNQKPYSLRAGLPLSGGAPHARASSAQTYPAGKRTHLRALLATVLTAVTLAACTTQRFDPKNLEMISETAEVPRSRAMLVPAPGSATVLSVLENRYTNAYVQELMLETNSSRPGQNSFKVTFVLPGATGGPGTRDLDVQNLAPDMLHAEIADKFPDMAMQISSLYVQNRYGPFGFAVGRSAIGGNCLYAWQTITRNRYATLIDGTGGKIDIRLQFCDAAASDADLLEVMYGFTINSYLSRWDWQPYGDPPPPSADMGLAGAEVRPSTLTPLGLVPTPAQQVRSLPRREPARRRTAQDADPLLYDEPATPRRTVPVQTDFSQYPSVPPPP